MANGLQTNSIEPTKVDTLASDACTRSGAFALLLSVALLLLVPYWAQQPVRAALGRYIAFRNDLALRVDELKDDPFWQKYEVSHRTAEYMSIAQLLKVRVNAADITKAVSDKTQATPVATAKRAPAHPRSRVLPPSPPTALRAEVLVKIAEMHPIADYLGELNNSEMLTQAREYSNFFDLSILRWVQKRNDLVYLNAIDKGCYKGRSLVVPHKERETELFVPALEEKALLGCLTLQDVQELAKSDFPKISNPTQIGGRIGGKVDITAGSLPRDPYIASIVVQILLFFVIIYFAAFAREAISSPSFPVQGTLFGAFSGSRKTLAVFLLALWSPLVMSAVVAVVSRNWMLAVCSVFIFLAVLSVHLELHRSSYFQPLCPRLFPSNKRRTVD